MTVESISSDFEPNETSFDIQANPETWILLALLLDKLDFFGFYGANAYSGTTDSFDAGLKHFFKTGIHQMPQEVQKDREEIGTNLEHWMRDFSLQPIQIADLELIEHASSGTYFLYEGDTPTHVIKPADEDIFALNDPFTPWLPGAHLRARDNIPLYHAPERECAGFEISRTFKLDIVPITSMAVIDSPHFHDITDSFHSGAWNRTLHFLNMEKKAAAFMEACGDRSSVKLCSLREYVPHSMTLSHFMDNEEHSIDDIDPNDVVAAHLIMWVTGNTDGHPGNILVYPKGVQENGRPLWGLKIIDLCLTFPETNSHLLNTLPDTLLAPSTLPEWAEQWIQNLSIEEIMAISSKYHLHGAADATRERIEALKMLATQNLSIEEIDTRLKYLGTQKQAALNVTEPFKLPRYNTSFASTSWTTSSTLTTPPAWLRV
jgi:hypothetical protein